MSAVMILLDVSACSATPEHRALVERYLIPTVTYLHNEGVSKDKAVKMGLVLFGGYGASHTLTTQLISFTYNVEHIVNLIRNTPCRAGGTGSALSDALAVCLKSFLRVSETKYCLIATSALPETSIVRTVPEYCGKTITEVVDLFMGTALSLFSSRPLPTLWKQLHIASESEALPGLKIVWKFP